MQSVMLTSSELESVLNGVDGARVEHSEVDHQAEVLRFIYDLWRDTLTTSAIFTLASMAT